MNQKHKRKSEHQAATLRITRQEMIALQEVPVVYALLLLTTLPPSTGRETILDKLQNVEKRITALLTQKGSPSEPLPFDLLLDELCALHTALLAYMMLAQTHPIMFEQTKIKLLEAFSKRLVTFLAPHFPAVVLN